MKIPPLIKNTFIALAIMLSACVPQVTPAVVTVVVTATPNAQITQPVPVAAQPTPMPTNTLVVQNATPQPPIGGQNQPPPPRLSGTPPAAGQPPQGGGQQPGGGQQGGQPTSSGAATNIPVTLKVVNGATPSSATVNLKSLPIGDKKVSTSPQRGYIWSCQTTFVSGSAGASATGAWFNSAAGIYDLTIKPVVDGSVSWQGKITISLQDTRRIISGNNLPSHTTGTFPVASSDDAAKYDRNPNKISAQTLQLALTANPTASSQAFCAGGTVAILLTGSYVFNGFDAGGRDAVAHELQDHCQGHPQSAGAYHYHSVSACIDDNTGGHSKLVGYAMDGFGLYGYRGENGKDLTNADLDECHGHTHEIEWDGKKVVMYHYHATWEFPYTIGCFRANAIRVGGGEGGGQQPGGGGQPGGGQQPGGTLPPRPGGGSPPPPPRP